MERNHQQPLPWLPHLCGAVWTTTAAAIVFQQLCSSTTRLWCHEEEDSISSGCMTMWADGAHARVATVGSAISMAFRTMDLNSCGMPHLYENWRARATANIQWRPCQCRMNCCVRSHWLVCRCESRWACLSHVEWQEARSCKGCLYVLRWHSELWGMLCEDWPMQQQSSWCAKRDAQCAMQLMMLMCCAHHIDRIDAHCCHVVMLPAKRTAVLIVWLSLRKCLLLSFNPFSLHHLNSHHITFFYAFNRADKELHIPLLEVYRMTLGWWVMFIGTGSM